jgi:diguanylate cyclase (GGDEF)-like protein
VTDRPPASHAAQASHSNLPVASIALAFAVAVMPVALAAPADPFASARVHVREYFDTDGLPQNSVESMALDDYGELWITTRDGGAVFDGTAWIAVPMPDELGSNWPRVALPTSDGAVWFGVEPEGLARLRNGEWRTWAAAAGLPGRVTAMVEHGGTLIVATSRGIVAFDLASPGPVVELAGVAVNALARGADRLLAATAAGDILARHDDEWTAAGTRGVAPAVPTSMLVRENEILVGTNEGIATLRKSAAPVFDLAGIPVTAVAETRFADGSTKLWAATEGSGLLVRESGTWVAASPGIAVPNRFVLSLVVAPTDGPAVHLFAGTLSGIARIDLAAWRRIGTSEGLPESSVVSILESRVVTPGTYYLGTTAGLAVFGAEGTWLPHPCADLASAPVFSMLESASTGRIYFGTADGVVAVGRDGCRPIPGLDKMPVVSLAETRTGNHRVWAGTYGHGLWGLGESEAWTPFPYDLPDSRIEALAVSGAPDDALWIATNKGLVRVAGGVARVYGPESGLPHETARSILIRDGTIWVGTAKGPAWADVDADEPRWSAIDLKADGRMHNDTVYRLEKDAVGRIHAFTGRGIARLSPVGRGGPPRLGRVFLSDDGLPSNETNFGASMIDSQGRIWAGTPRGVGIFDPALEGGAESVEHRLVVVVKVEPDATIVRDGDVLPHDADRITATFRLIDLAHGHRAVYQTQLDGLEAQPGEWTSAAQRTFTKLPGGKYGLKVWASDPHGHEAGPYTFSFSIQQPPWLSWWAVLIYVVVSVVALYAAVGLRLRSLRRRNKELELIVRSRTRDLEVANRQLETTNVTLADMSVTDPLTGARNRRYLLQKMEQEAIRVRRSTREDDDVVFVIVDIDRFKALNDRFGHATGDHVLKQFHRVLLSAVRDTDTIVRWGGEEFLIVARRISRDEATLLADRVLRMVRDMLFESSDGSRQIRLTCSVGFAAFPFVPWDRGLFTWEQVVDIADHCLYTVKRSGRDGWVGLAAGPELRADSFPSRMRDDLPQMAARDEVVVMTSIGDPARLVWQ